jgi:pyrroloquinoline quinone (PQQ) biosynthesis protein C
MSFYDRLVCETAVEREEFLAIPLVRHAVQAGASRALYLRFLAEAYHHVKHTFPLLALAASRTNDERLQDAMVEYMEEERGHEKWILDDIRALGGDAEAVQAGDGSPACRIMVAYSYYAVERVSPYALLGSVHVLEGMSALLAGRLADALRMSLKLDGEDGFSYLRSHGLLDVDHVAFFRELVDGFEEAPTQRIIIDSSRIFYRLYGAIFRDLSVDAELDHAA